MDSVIHPWRKSGEVSSIMSLTPWRKNSTEYQPLSQAKIRCTIQDCTLHFLSPIYTGCIPSCRGLKYLFPHPMLFQFTCPLRPASWADSHAGLPVSECLSLVISVRKLPANITSTCALPPRLGWLLENTFTKLGKGYKVRGRRGSHRY